MKKITVTFLLIISTTLNIIAEEQPDAQMLEVSKRALLLLDKQIAVDDNLVLFWEKNYRTATLNLATTNDEKILVWEEWKSKLVQRRKSLYERYQVGIDNLIEIHKFDFMIAESKFEILKLSRSQVVGK